MNKPHSQEYITGPRSFWNDDFLQLAVKRLKLPGKVQRLVEVGIGKGDWTTALLPHLGEKIEVFGVDAEEHWVMSAKERLSTHEHSPARLEVVQAHAEKLPFENSFCDLVTCQTFLMHVSDPQSVLEEMLRVLRPGATLLCSEPNNFYNFVPMDSHSVSLTVDELVQRYRLWLCYCRGYSAEGLGSMDLGEHLPFILKQLGLENIQTCISDKTWELSPPYDTELQQAIIRQMRLWMENQTCQFDRDEVRRLALAGGMDEQEFDAAFDNHLRHAQQQQRAIDKNRYYSAGGSLLYLVSGTKPIS